MVFFVVFWLFCFVFCDVERSWGLVFWGLVVFIVWWGVVVFEFLVLGVVCIVVVFWGFCCFCLEWSVFL